jgi:hypothetical protein
MPEAVALNKSIALLFEEGKVMTKKCMPDHGDKESRIRKAYERLGTTTPSCLICGETNPLRLELHHPAQRQYDDRTIILCSNHHDEASDWQRDHPFKIEGCTSLIEVAAHWLFGLGDLAKIAADESWAAQVKPLLSYIAMLLHEIGHLLINLARTKAASAAPGAI